MSGARSESAGGEAVQKSDELKRAQVPVRTTAKTKAQLQAAADRNDRSLTQEIEQRLERSLEQEARHGGYATAALIARIVADIAEIEEATGKPWHKDNETFAAVRRAVIGTVLDSAPSEVENNSEAVAAYQIALKAVEMVNLLLEMKHGGMPDDPETDAIVRAAGISRLSKAQSDADAAIAAAEAAYEPQRAAERRGRELHKRLTASRAASPSGFRSLARGA